ncbi:MAG: thioredoxin [Wujia sp.]
MAVIKLTSENFEEVVLKSDKKVMVDFYADWCGPCKMLSPLVDEISEERQDVVVGKLNVDENPDITEKYMIMSIPSVFVFEKGEISGKSIGAVPKSELLKML